MMERHPRKSGEGGMSRFASYVSELDGGARAALRRSLAFPPGTWPGAFPYVEPWVSTASSWERQVAYLVAGLQAHSRAGESKGNLGEAALALSHATESGSVEARFLALLDADTDQLPHRLRQMITLMSSNGIAPDWAQLRSDLNWWRTENRNVQQRWARSFYYRPSPPEEETQEPDSDTKRSSSEASDASGWKKE